MAVLEVTLSGTYFEQLTINRWNYISTGTPSSVSLSFALASAFGALYDQIAVPSGYPAATPLAEIANITSDHWDWEQVTVLNPYDPEDFYQTPFVVPYGGKLAGEAQSPIAAWGFRTNQVRRDVARGTKRFPGVLESWTGTGGIVETSQISLLNAVADAMSGILTYDDEGNTISFSPAVCGKFHYDPNPSIPTANHRAYRYWATEAQQLLHTATGVLWQRYDSVRSQVSRQYGKGR